MNSLKGDHWSPSHSNIHYNLLILMSYVATMHLLKHPKTSYFHVAQSSALAKRLLIYNRSKRYHYNESHQPVCVKNK